MPRDNAQRQRSMRAPRRTVRKPLYAAVDLGTNNCRLLIARGTQHGFSVVDSHAQIARLGEGLATTGRLSEAAVERALVALKAIREKLKARRVGHVRCVATEACRRAENGKDFVETVRRELGLTFRIIPPREEVHLAAVGCHDLIDDDASLVMVLDIGGGSTEISFVDATGLPDRSLRTFVNKMPIRAWRSFPMGVVTLSESFAHLGEAEAYAAMTAHAAEAFQNWTSGQSFAEGMGQNTARLIGTSGTVTCLAGIHKQLPKYRRDLVDGTWLTTDEARAAIAQLQEAGPDGRAKLPTIGPERAGLILAGCAILDAAWQVWPSNGLRVADRGLREGLLLTMIHGERSRRRPRRRTRSSGNGAANAG